jgi:DNA-binding transcriptional MocR family regulator
VTQEGSLRRWIQAKREEGARRQLIAREILGGANIQSHPMRWHLWWTLEFPQRAEDIESKLLRQEVRIVGARSFAPVHAAYPEAIRISLGREMNIDHLIAGLTRCKQSSALEPVLSWSGDRPQWPFHRPTPRLTSRRLSPAAGHATVSL